MWWRIAVVLRNRIARTIAFLPATKAIEAVRKSLINMVLIPRMLRMDWALEGFPSGDREVLLEILVRDPRTKSIEQAEAAIEEIPFLPFSRAKVQI